MGIKAQITGSGSNKFVDVIQKTINGVLRTGLNVYTTPLVDRSLNFGFAVNPTFGNDMAQDASFSGTPVEVHDGLDNVYWTGTNIIGAKTIFNSTDQANTGTQSVRTTNAGTNDVYQFDQGSDLTIANYVAITFSIYVSSNWTDDDSVSIYAWDTGTASQVGNKVLIEDLFTFSSFGNWQGVVVTFDNLGISSGTFDAIRFEQEAKSGAAPTYYLDDIQIEESGGLEIYTVEPPIGTKYSVNEIIFTMADALDTTLLNATAFNADYKALLGEPALTNGINATAVIDGEVLLAFNIKTLGDLLKGGSELRPVVASATDVCLSLSLKLPEPIHLNSKDEDVIEFSISDNLSGLDNLSVLTLGYVEQLDG